MLNDVSQRSLKQKVKLIVNRVEWGLSENGEDGGKRKILIKGYKLSVLR